MESGERSVPARSRPEPELGNWALWRTFLVCLGGAAGFFWANNQLAKLGMTSWAEIATHVGIAFLVAGVLLITLEFRAKRVLHREVLGFLDEVARNVYKALLERIVPEEVFNEMNEILRTEVIRRDCEYWITFMKPRSDMPPGYFVIRRTLTFTVENQLNKSTVFPIRSVYSGSEKLTSDAWRGRQFHTRLEINGSPVRIEEGKNLFMRDGKPVLEHPIRLGPRGSGTDSAEVLLLGEEPCFVAAGHNSYTQGTPVIGIKVTIFNEHPEAITAPSVQMNHPAREQTKHVAALSRYHLERAFLPGQGFEIGWETTEGRPAAQLSAAEADQSRGV